jgi:MFS family permease
VSSTGRTGRAIGRIPLLSGLPREVAVLSAVAFCVALGFGIVGPILPVFASSFGATNLEAGMVVASFALVRLVTSPLSGALVDRVGERLVMSTGLIIVAASSALAGLSQSFVQLLVLRGVGGLGSSMFTVSALALLLRVVETEQRGRAAGAFQGGFLLGGITGPALGGIVVAVSIRAPFFVYAASLTAATVVALVFMSKSHLREREHKVAGGEENKLEQLRTAFRDRAYRAAVGTNLVAGFVVFGLRASAIPLFVKEGMERTASFTSWAFFLAAVLQGLLLLPAGRMADTQGRRKALLIGTIGTTVGMTVLTATDFAINGRGSQAVLATALFLLALAIQGAAGAFLGSAPAAVVGDTLGGRRGGIVVATFQMMSDVGAVTGPLVAGLLIDSFDFSWAFAVGAVLSLFAVALVFFMPETLKRNPDTATA